MTGDGGDALPVNHSLTYFAAERVSLIVGSAEAEAKLARPGD